MQGDLEHPVDSTLKTAEGAVAQGTRHRSFGKRLAEELRRFAVMFVYLWIMFGLFVLNEHIILGERGINFTTQGFALLNALVLAKVVLIADYLGAGALLRQRPLIYRILFDSVFLTVLFLSVHVIESMITGLFRGDSVAGSMPVIGGGGFAGVLCVALILFISLIPFFGFRLISEEIGAEKLNEILFGPAKKDSGLQEQKH